MKGKGNCLILKQLYQTLVAQPGVCRELQATQCNRPYMGTQEVGIVGAALHAAERSRLLQSGLAWHPHHC